MRAAAILRPVQAVRTAKARLGAQIRMWRFASYGRRRFQSDSRYDLRSVTDGFASRLDESSDDANIIARICAAWQFSRARYKELGSIPEDPSPQIPHEGLQPSIRALMGSDTDALGRMYRNFYRDPCSSGLMAAPGGMANAYFSSHIRDMYRRFYLAHVLHRLDYWRELTHGKYSLDQLTGPGVGNPFGVVINGTHIAVGAEYSHYCAHRVSSLIDRVASPRPVLAEIGGGFGAMAYFLLRDHQPLSWVGFDTPERIALSTYYLMKAFPQFRFVLYGERPLTRETLLQADVMLLPGIALGEIPAASADITFSSQGLSRLAPGAMRSCLRRVTAITRQSLLYIGYPEASAQIAKILAEQEDSFIPVDTFVSGWHTRGVSGAGVGGAAGAAASSLVEQSFVRQRLLNHATDEVSSASPTTTALEDQCR